MLAFVAVASAIEYPGYQHHSSHGGQAYEAAPVYHAAPVHYAAPAVVKTAPGTLTFLVYILEIIQPFLSNPSL